MGNSDFIALARMSKKMVWMQRQILQTQLPRSPNGRQIAMAQKNAFESAKTAAKNAAAKTGRLLRTVGEAIRKQGE